MADLPPDFDPDFGQVLDDLLASFPEKDELPLDAAAGLASDDSSSSVSTVPSICAVFVCMRC